MTSPRIYLESTIPSFLVARPSRDIVLRGQQEATRRWWEQGRKNARCFVSVVVAEEIAAGDPEVAARRMEAIRGIPLLDLNEEVADLAARILATGLIPPKATADASHLALAAVHGVEFLLTWNCRHIHNVVITRRVERICEEAGFSCPVICTPFDLLPSLSHENELDS